MAITKHTLLVVKRTFTSKLSTLVGVPIGIGGAVAVSTPRWRNFSYRYWPCFHGFQIMDRKRCPIHLSIAFSSEGV
jgi:hypothetical protein